MNSTFKVVFNKARGTLMVANELTSSVQKKGVSLVVATAAALTFMTAPVVNAANISDQTFDSETTSASGGALTLDQDNANTISGSTFKNNTAAVKGGAVVIKKDTVITNSTFDFNRQTSTAKDTAGGAVFINGAKVEISGNSKFNQNTGFLGGAVNVRGGSTLSIKDSVFSGNTANGFGGAISDYEDKEGAVKNELISISGTRFENNRDSQGGGALHLVNTKAIDITDSEFSSNFSAGKGGVIQLENGSQLAVTNTVFNGNSTNSWGGAIRVLGADATISATKDISMTGNKANVNGLMSASYSDMGGFAYLQGNSKLTLAGENGATLTIGDANAVDKTIDSIASLGGYESSANELILKGNVVINSSLEAFSDKITVADNANVTMATGFASDRILLQADINKYGNEAYDDYGSSELSLGEKATLTMGDLVINRAGFTGVNGVKEYGNPGVKITVGQNSTLNLKSLSIDTKKYLSKGKETNVTTTGYGLFNLTDAAVNVDGDVTLAEQTRLDLTGSGNFDVNGKVNVAGQMTVSGTQDGTLKLSTNDLSINGGSLTIGDNATLAAPLAVVFTGNPTLESTSLTLLTGLSFARNSAICITDRGTYKTTFLETLKTASNAGGVSLPNATLAIDASTESYHFDYDVTMNALDAKDTSLTVTKKLNIGTFDASSGDVAHSTSTVKSITLNGSEAQLAVGGQSTLKVETLDGTGTIYIGNDASAGDLQVGKSTFKGMIILDPAFTTDSTIADASRYAATDLSSPVAAQFAVLRNSVISLGAPIGTAYNAFNDLAQKNGLDWSATGVSAAAYIDAPVTFGGTSGGIVINGALTSSAAPSVTANQVSVAANGMLIVNQQNVGDKQVFSTSDDAGTTVTFAAGSYLGLVNAQEGTLALADTVTADDNAKVVTDNPFFTGAFVTNEAGATVVTTSFDSDSGLSAIASTGIQSMARRADFVMSETVANRTSLDQQLNAGVNLWVDVTGERYESDKLDNNGSFRADAGYAMFGGDVQVADGLTAGLALQYGDATVRSDVASIKNEINSYGLTAYVGQTFGAAKVVGEISWLRTENDITSSQTALNQSLDTNVYSAGLRAQYELTAGAFKFIPSIGLRVSHLETDDMTIGAINASTSDLTYVQMPIALRITGAEVNASGWTFAPSFKIAYVPTFGDKDIKFYGASQNVLDMSPVQADFGLRAVNGNLMFNADMMIGGGEYGTSSVGGKVGVKYVF